ncbi:hypothetical protein L2E82_15149 [Cichorium intybus]|uniref:Uncharacterized protein n=1 Tax=Cichorium intybus TaxID=13427 RepID=A0ACB9F2W6_CICIN|nr:hypothetical protein L2E82_15149 [Cichorium intybus]
MASSSSSNSWILSLKVLLISAGLVSVAVTMKLAVPMMLNFAVYDLPVIWSVLVSLLKPPYLYVVINGIIITIAASTRFQHNNHQDNQSQQQVNPPTALPPSDLTSGLPPVSIRRSLDAVEHPTVVYDIEPSVIEPPLVYESEPAVVDVNMVAVSGPEVVRGDEHEFVISRSTWKPPQSIIKSPPPKKVLSESIFPVREKELISSRFAHHRKPTPEGARVLRVLKPKKHETLETTWKMITEKHHMPLARHLRKSDTFVNHHHDGQSEEPAEAAKTKVMKKSETFNDHMNYENENDYPNPSSTNSTPASAGKLKKEGSLSNDELNRRVEAFIKKFNDDMRLQRQESLNQYMEMVNRGAH